jgi:hypothetical protein
MNSATCGDVGASRTSQPPQSPHTSRSSEAKKQFFTVEKLDIQKSSNTQYETITPEELDDMIVSTDSVPGDGVLIQMSFKKC